MKLRLMLGSVLLTVTLPLLAVPSIERWPGNVSDHAALQNGARLFFSHCQACHAPIPLRADQLQLLGMSEQQLYDELWAGLENEKGELGQVTGRQNLLRTFGVEAPDLTAFMRAPVRGNSQRADWVYTLLRSYYPDEKAICGWNNVLRPGFAMPSVLQGLPPAPLNMVKQGGSSPPVLRTESEEVFDKRVSDLVAYLVWATGTSRERGQGAPEDVEPHSRWVAIGLLILGTLCAAVYILKREYWKDVA